MDFAGRPSRESSVVYYIELYYWIDDECSILCDVVADIGYRDISTSTRLATGNWCCCWCCCSSIIEQPSIKVWWDRCRSIRLHTVHKSIDGWGIKVYGARESVQWADVYVITWGNDRAPRFGMASVFSCVASHILKWPWQKEAFQDSWTRKWLRLMLMRDCTAASQ
jgi:hypothetical protein